MEIAKKEIEKEIETVKETTTETAKKTGKKKKAKKKATNRTPIRRMSRVKPWESAATTTVINIMVAKSAIKAAIKSAWPKIPLLKRRSFNTGTTTPSDVVERISAIIQISLT